MKSPRTKNIPSVMLLTILLMSRLLLKNLPKDYFNFRFGVLYPKKKSLGSMSHTPFSQQVAMQECEIEKKKKKDQIEEQSRKE